ncbi:MAG: Carbon monoxide dehydrogenase medium chain [Pseudomonadota bacterium]
MSLASSYQAPSTLPEVLRLLSANATGATPRPLAGGSDLIVQMGAGRHPSSMFVDLKRVPELVGISRHEGGWRIAAATPCAVMGEHAELRADWPGVVEAANLIGSKQVQGRATVAGNLCNASPGADSVPALIAAGAIAEIGILGPDGAIKIRELPVEAIPQGPGRTNLAPGELVLALRLPKRAERASDAYLRLIPRTEMDIAVVGCGVSMTLDADGRIVTARVALGAVAPTALLVPAAAEALIGSKLETEALAKLAAAASAACKPIDDKRGTAAYRTQVAGVLARRAATQAYQRALNRSAQENRT